MRESCGSAVALGAAELDPELAEPLRALVAGSGGTAHRLRLERDVTQLLGRVWPAVVEFVRSGTPIPDEALSLLAEAADALAAGGVSRQSLVRLTRQLAALAASKLAALGADAAEAGGRALVATHDLVSALLSGVLPDRPSHDAHPLDPLDPLERDILVLVAAGSSTVEIARALHYSRQAVSYHLGRLMTRFGVRNRTALVAFAYEHGLLDRRAARVVGAAFPRAVSAVPVRPDRPARSGSARA